MKSIAVIISAFFCINCLAYSNNICTFASWIERTCKPFDKGKLTAFPRFNIVSRNLNMSAMLRFEDLPEVNSERWLSLEDFEGEIWKNINGYEGVYQISNYGRIKSLERVFPHLGGHRSIKTKICKLQKDKGTGYSKYVLSNNGKKSPKSVHRLVAETFIPNPQNLPFVNHRDEIRTNNCVENLEWCTPQYNLEYSNVNQRIAEKLYKRVVQYDKDWNVLNIYKTTGDAARALGLSGYSSIARCCKGEIGSVKGFIWRYEDEVNIPHKNPRQRRVVQKNKNKEIINTYDSIKDASINTKIGASSILRCCKGKNKQAGGFLWEYVDNYVDTLCNIKKK